MKLRRRDILTVGAATATALHQTSCGNADEFDYLNGRDLHDVNQTAFDSTVKAHHDGGVPYMILRTPTLNAHYLGQLFYFFEYTCFVSGALLVVNSFDQPGVEAYKKNMFAGLGQ